MSRIHILNVILVSIYIFRLPIYLQPQFVRKAGLYAMKFRTHAHTFSAAHSILLFNSIFQYIITV